MRIRTGNRTAIRTRVDAQYSYSTEIRIAIRFAANCTGIRTGNRIRPLIQPQLHFGNLAVRGKTERERKKPLIARFTVEQGDDDDEAARDGNFSFSAARA
jgi:hypothetical protein